MIASSKFPSWFEPGLRHATETCLPLIIERRARENPEGILAVFEDSAIWTNVEAWQITRRTAAGLQSLGVRKGDRVLLWLPNGSSLLQTWWAANLLGAIVVPMNVSLRGSTLEHVIRTTGAEVIVAHADLLPRLEQIDTCDLKQLVIAGSGRSPDIRGIAMHAADRLEQDSQSLCELPPIHPWDVASLIFTSGTTGLSKGVVNPYAQLATLGRAMYGYLEPQDRVMTVYPLFHIASIGAVYGAMIRGGSLGVVERFQTERFWDQIRQTGSTALPGINPAMIEFLLKQPERPDDHGSPLRFVNATKVTDRVRLFSARFGCRYIVSYSMTETSCILASELDPVVEGTCGRRRSGLEVRLVDEHDIEVPVGAVGELIVRSESPWELNLGYFGNSDASQRAWRNGWFHTGDLLRRDANGDFFYVDRLKDSIRRRGENVSSVELEQQALVHPDVDAAAAYGVPADEGDEEIVLAVVPRTGCTIDPEAFTRFLIEHLPYFMVPRFVRMLKSLPKTESGKVQKTELRKERTAGAWDRMAAGIAVKGERFSGKRTND